MNGFCEGHCIIKYSHLYQLSYESRGLWMVMSVRLYILGFQDERNMNKRQTN